MIDYSVKLYAVVVAVSIVVALITSNAPTSLVVVIVLLAATLIMLGVFVQLAISGSLFGPGNTHTSSPKPSVPNYTKNSGRKPRL